MAGQYKTSMKMYSAWNYEKEIEDLNKASEKGWQLVKGGLLASRFKKDPGVRYRYQMDYRRIDDMARYIETFREQGWEYVNSTFNGWHYLRKLYDPSLPEEAYEIFTDRESLREMNGRWARLGLALGIVAGVAALLYGVWMILRFQIPVALVFLLLAAESAVLLRGWFIMRDPDKSRNRRGDGALLAVFLAAILLGGAASIALAANRVSLQTEQKAGDIDHPVIDSRWADFEVKYPDFYYVDLTVEAEKPVDFAILNEKDEPVFEIHEKSYRTENRRILLPRGRYRLSFSAETGYRVEFGIG